MRRTNLRGHALRSEGKPYLPGDEEPWVRVSRRDGHGLCECGAASAFMRSDADRKRWHVIHKATTQKITVDTASLPNRSTEE